MVLRSLVLGSVALGGAAAGCTVYHAQSQYYAVTTVTETTTVATAQPPESRPQSSVWIGSSPPAAPGAPIDADQMHAALDSYGRWMQDGLYGDVWVPTQVEPGFVPYGTDGSWTFSDVGWYWRSDLAWGWLPFHYGRWVLVEETWAWVPGSAFAPAWVDWRYGEGWVGWAPLPPVGSAFTAPYAYVTYSGLEGEALWSRVVYGPAAASLYLRTAEIETHYGYGGAVYCWGPAPAVIGLPVSPVPLAQAVETRVPPPAVPVAGSGSMVVVGNPVGGSSGGGGSNVPQGGAGVPVGVPVASAPRATTSLGTIPALPSLPATRPVTTANPVAMAEHASSLPSYPVVHPSFVPLPTQDPEGAWGSSSPRLSGTTSLGTSWAEPPVAYHPSVGGYAPTPVATSAPVSAGASGYVPRAADYTNAPSYTPPPVATTPSYVPHPSYAPSYAPPAASSYHPSYTPPPVAAVAPSFQPAFTPPAAAFRGGFRR